ncbi:hypothetical protein [Thioalkalivibrio sp. ALJ2]|uniref:hypothetical protein n=1 Tax=Thioalkalivibrio sp. ALJ2 TaxID=1261622 RepID=UPI000382531A|nr:hypothetical protein [Thioalkalivibrio sp. ALJ2]
MTKIRDLTNAEHIVSPIAGVLAAVHNITRPLQEAHRAIIKTAERNRELFADIQRSLDQISVFADAIEREERLGEAGWIPHPLLPLSQVTPELMDDPERLDELLLTHLFEQWASVEAQLLDDEVFSVLDDGHRETVRQALEAHQAGLYRCVPRTLFGEIEMAAHGALDGIELPGKITAQLRPVWALLDKLPISQLQIGGTTGIGYLLAEKAVYGDTRAGGADSRLPNRHDQVHGFSRTHATERDSANTLLLADMMFRLLATLKAEAEQLAELGHGENGSPAIHR